MSRARGLRVQGRGLSVLGSEYRIEGLRAEGSGFGIRVQTSKFWFRLRSQELGLGFRLRV